MSNLTQTPPSEKTPTVHLKYLDGLRSLAAIWVVLFHFVGFNVPSLASNAARIAFGWLANGQLAVSVFIVLSGYLLMIPVSRSADGTFRHGLQDFVRRRAKRILPPYWAALALAIILLLVSSDGKALLHQHVTPFLATNLSLKSFVSHVLLLHNLCPDTVKQISGPFWSVAAEWDIYFIFALLLRPFWKRFGIIPNTLLAFGIGFAPLCLCPEASNFAWTSPWFIGLFAAGMTASEWNFGHQRFWKTNTAITTLIGVVVVSEVAMLMSRHYLIWLPDVVIGLSVAILMAYCTQSIQRQRQPFPVRLMEWRPVASMEAFSYSLYLTHATAVIKLNPIIEHIHPTPEVRCAIGLFIETPIALMFAKAFAYLFERPFLSQRQKSKTS